MPDTSSTTTQSQGGTDASVTTGLSPSTRSSVQTNKAYQRTSSTMQRVDFTISFVLTPNEPPKGIPVL